MFARQCERLFPGHAYICSVCRYACSSTRFDPGPDNRKVRLQKNFLIDKLELTMEEANYFVRKHNVAAVSPERLARALDMLLGLGLRRSEVRACPQVLLIKPLTIKQRALLLQEGGVRTITPCCLFSYLQLANKRVSLLKTCGLVPENVDVAHSMLEHLEENPGPLPSLGDAVTFTNTQAAVVRHYLRWRLDLDPADVERIMRTYVRIRNKSLRLISCTLAILEHELGFSRDKIKSNGYLIHSHPDNTLRTLREVPEIGGVPFKDVVSLYPKIVMAPTDTLLATLRCLQEFGISDEAVRRNPQVFTLSSESVRMRLEQINTLPGLSGLLRHPRVLQLVQYLHKARARLSTLQDLQVRCASLHVLCGTQERFERYTQEGEDRTRGNDVVHYLSAKLGGNSVELRAQLRRHPYWKHVPLRAVKMTCDRLLQLGYSRSDVIRNVHLLLYPWDAVRVELVRLQARPELGCNVFLAAGGGVLSSSCQLALCLYFIERKFHFTGDGVWLGLPLAAEQHV